ncbi:MAG: rod shape-determining protein MreD [Brevinemataceae bacterium]
MKTEKQILLYLFFSIIFLAIQSMQLISINGVYPDLIMILVLIYSFSRGSFKGLWFCFFMGLMLDTMSGSLFGLNAFIFTFLGSFSSIFRKAVKLANIVVYILYVIFATFVKYILYALFLKIYNNVQLFDWLFVLKIPSESVINIVFGICLYIIFARFDSRENYEWF